MPSLVCLGLAQAIEFMEKELEAKRKRLKALKAEATKLEKQIAADAEQLGLLQDRFDQDCGDG